jgi:hypothetical protein
MLYEQTNNYNTAMRVTLLLLKFVPQGQNFSNNLTEKSVAFFRNKKFRYV